jgi:hypothetical protein
MYESSTKVNRTPETCPSSYSPFTREEEKLFTCNKKPTSPHICFVTEDNLFVPGGEEKIQKFYEKFTRPEGV